MGESLVLMQRQGGWSLAVRTHDLGGTDYGIILRLTDAQAFAMAGDHTGIYGLYNNPVLLPALEKQEIFIRRRQDRPANTRSWSLCLGEEHVAFITDEAVRLLQEHAKPRFEPGEPNWTTREIEDLDDQILAAETKLETLRQRRQALSEGVSDSVPQPE